MSGKRSWWVGAYALTATLENFSESDAADFYAAIHQLPGLAGLELPLHLFMKKDDPWRHLHCVPRDLDFILTPLPYVMQSLENKPFFGLASPDAEGRAAALRFMSEIRQRIRRLEDHTGRAAVRAVQLHSAPTGQANAAAFRSSLEDILPQHWGAVELWLEHCDAVIPGQTAAKGFLSLPDEVAIAKELGLGITINWGRSVLETRRAQGALEHIQAAVQAGVLRSLFLSSTAQNDPLYGTWLDNHAPVQGIGQGAWRPTHSLLNADAVQAALVAAAEVPCLGLKIQPFPVTLSLSERIDCVRQHLEFLRPISDGT